MLQKLGWMQSLTVGSFLILSSSPAVAQITPDDTLGAERSRLTPNATLNGTPINRIEGGAARNRNLFHSFQDFNVGNGQRVYFANPPGIETILTRVTGSNASNILGTLGVEGNANLFLLNPNGILFGQNARLDVRGSFVGTTASGIQFGNQGVFGTSNLSAPALLTVNPSALLFDRINAGTIVNRSRTPLGVTPLGAELFGLQVPQGQNLALVGGNVNFEGGGVNAPEGRVEIGAVAGTGSVGLTQSGTRLSLNLPPEVGRSDVALTDGILNVAGSGEGTLAITARNINFSGDSFLRAGIESGQGSVNAQAGDILLDATSSIQVGDTTAIANIVRKNAVGNGGNIRINTGSLLMKDEAALLTNLEGQGKGGDITVNTNSLNASSSARLDTSASGRGKAGNVVINARDSVALDGAGIVSDVEKGAIAQGGNIRVTTGTLSLTNGAQLEAGTFGQGNSGDLSINARDIVFQGFSSSRDGVIFPSGVLARVEEGASGNAGNVRITTESLSLFDGATITTSTRGRGNAGNIFIDARDRVSLQAPRTTAINSDIERNGIGNGGTIQIQTEALSLADGSFISSNSNGQGNAGNIMIDTGSLSMTRSDPALFFSGDISTKTARQGNAGNITINARNGISIDRGAISTGVLDTGANEAGFAGRGQGGDIRITTGSLRLTNSAQLFSSSSGQGDAGKIGVDARDVISVDGGSTINTGVSSFQGSTAKGQAGKIQIHARSLLVTNGGNVLSVTDGQGDAGNIEIQAADQVVVDGGSAERFTVIGSSVLTGGVGRGGDIQILTGTLSLAHGALLSSATGGRGNAGNINIQARDRVFLSQGSQFLTSTIGQGNAGNIQIRASEQVSLLGTSPISGKISQIASTVGTTGQGNGGSIFIDTRKLNLDNKAGIIASSIGNGEAGQIQAQAKTIRLNDGSFIAAETTTANGGNITLGTDTLVLRRGSNISATGGITQGGGNGGNIKIDAKSIVAPTSEDSNIFANAFGGKGGNINIDAQGIFGIQARPKPTPESDITASSQLGVQGQIAINQPEVEPTQGVVELPIEVIDASNQIAQTCPRGSASRPLGEFVVTGRGSLPFSPIDPLTGTTGMSSLATLNRIPSNTQPRHTAASPRAIAPPVSGIAPPEIIEAQGWVKTRDGKVALVAVSEAATKATRPTAVCPVSKSQ